MSYQSCFLCFSEDDGQYSCYGHVKLLAAFIDDFPRYVKEEEKKAMDTMYKECSSSSYAPSLLRYNHAMIRYIDPSKQG